MPLVRLTGSYDRDALSVVAQHVHAAMIACLNVPEDDIFQVLDETPSGAVVANDGYLGIERKRPLFIEITLRAGRTDDAKRAFYRAVAERVTSVRAARAEDLLIVLRENAAIDWSFGNGIAQGAPTNAEATR